MKEKMTFDLGEETGMQLSEEELQELKQVLEELVAIGRVGGPPRGDIIGAPSGSVLNRMKVLYPELYKKVKSRGRLVELARDLGFEVRGFPGGLGRKGSGTWETLDFPGN
ncbi:hypothetical protein JF546_19125 [Nitratireductor aquimarinus]|uniref:hypothetical protein n=1 Tax=Nitratireductor aquimarinus TaxID=889300 RepID=UPI001A8FE919|nr:hypothetical protein [Nitratireductor aquimarinus]MBN8245135.1 hypothetical protein [Nitratireductor aquimarinus]MBY6133520.1 hypothetical protein [Nitratireductor aquimarinus]MCA1304829.1 hypothetical protein [Nitratireductor aquimarinus]